MKFTRTASRCRRCGLAVAAWLPSLALAQLGGFGGSLGGELGAVSDKVIYGISLSGSRACGVATAHARLDTGWAAALGLSSLHPEFNGLDAEWVATGLRVWQWDERWSVQLSATHYGYSGDRLSRAYYTRDQAALSLDWDGRLSATLGWSPDTAWYAVGKGARAQRLWMAEVDGHQRLVGRLALDAGLGYLAREQGAGMAYGSVGLAWGVGPARLSLTRTASQAGQRWHVPDAAAAPRWVSAVLLAF